MTIRVVLADDQTLIRAGFRALIDSADDLDESLDGAVSERLLALTKRERDLVALVATGLSNDD